MKILLKEKRNMKFSNPILRNKLSLNKIIDFYGVFHRKYDDIVNKMHKFL